MMQRNLAAAASLRMRVPFRAWCISLLLALLAACGGGGGGGDSPAPPVAIAAQPSDQSAPEGRTATFTVTAYGQLAYRWQRLQGDTWTDIAGATSAAYTTPVLATGDSGTRYRVVVSSIANSSNAVTSSAATLTVTVVVVAPAIAVQPIGLSLVAGQDGMLSVTATGSSLAYQWQRLAGITFVDIAGENTPTLLLKGVPQGDDGARFRVVVHNNEGTVWSQEARLTVTAAPAIPLFTAEPKPASAVAGDPAAFSVAVTGVPAPTLAWQTSTDGLQWSDFAGQEQAGLVVPAVTIGDDGRWYRAVASNASGSVASAAARLTVVARPVAPSIVTQPVDVTVGLGATPGFSVAASASPSASYQWQVSTDAGATFSNINGATQATYTLAAVSLADDVRQFRVVVSNSAGSVTSAAAALHVVPGPQITRQPASQGWHPGRTEPLFIVAAAGDNLRYQWQSSSDCVAYADAPGATGSSYVHAGGASDTTQCVRALVSNAFSTTTSQPAGLYAQRWSFVHPRPHGDALLGLHWIDANTVVAVGDSSDVYRSTDAGLSWSLVNEGGWRAPLMYAVAFNGAGTGVAVGWSGWIHRSTDGGRHWVNLPTSGEGPPPDHLYAVDYESASVAVAVGRNGTIRRSTDGGLTWADAVNSGSAASLHSVRFRAGVGLSVGDSGSILRSIDGGLHWAPVPSGTSGGLYRLAFATDSTVVALGESGAILRSTDAGLTWQPAASGTSLGLNDVHFASGLVGVAMAGMGTSVRTVDGGATWSPIADPPWFGESIYAMRFGSDKVALAVGASGTIRRSVDAGMTWTDVSTGPRATLNGVAFATADVGVAVGLQGTILRSSDGGDSWNPVASGSAAQLQGVAFADARTGVAVAADGTVLRSTDAGVHWAPVASGSTLALYGVAFSGPSVGAIATGYGILRTTDGGATWSPAALAQPTDFRSISFGSNGVGVAVGSLGAIARSVDGGQSWQRVSSGTPQALNGVSHAGGNTFVAVGWNGAALRSTDGGQTWSVDVIFNREIHYGVAFGSGGVGVAVGDFTTIDATRDGGLSWGDDLSQKSAGLIGVAFAGPNVAIAVGTGGTIMRARY